MTEVRRPTGTPERRLTHSYSKREQLCSFCQAFEENARFPSWLDPSGSLDAFACLEPVRAHQRWTRS